MNIDKKKSILTIMNCCLCVLVVTIHLLSESIVSSDVDSAYYGLVYGFQGMISFAMQGFVMLSGVRMSMKYSSSPLNYVKFLAKRATRIIVPYIIWTIIYYLYFCYEEFYSFDISSLIKHIYTGSVVSPFYFIIVIVQFYIFMPLWRKMVKTINPLLIIPLSIFITILCYFSAYEYNDRIATTYLAYWVIGCYMGGHLDDYFKLLTKNRAFIISVTSITLGIRLYFLFNDSFMPGQFTTILHLFYSLVMLNFLFLCFMHFEKLRNVSLVKIIDKSSYGIFYVHCLLIYIINFWMTDNSIIKISHRLAIRSIFVLVVSISLCYAYVKAREYISGRIKHQSK